MFAVYLTIADVQGSFLAQVIQNQRLTQVQVKRPYALYFGEIKTTWKLLGNQSQRFFLRKEAYIYKRLLL